MGDDVAQNVLKLDMEVQMGNPNALLLNTKYLSYTKFQPLKDAYKIPIKNGYILAWADRCTDLKRGCAGGFGQDRVYLH